MKKYSGQIIFNIIVAVLGAIIFSTAGIGNSIGASIGFVIVLMSLLSGGNYYFVNLAATGKKVFQPSYVINEQTFESLNEPHDYIEVMKDLKNYPLCRQEASQMIEQWELYKKKSEALDAISSSGGVYEVVNQDIESVMLNNMTLFMKRAVILQASSRQDEIMAHKAYLKELTGRNEKILSDYTNLLIEASQLTGDDKAKSEVKSLNLIIDSIRDYRKELEREDNDL